MSRRRRRDHREAEVVWRRGLPDEVRRSIPDEEPPEPPRRPLDDRERAVELARAAVPRRLAVRDDVRPSRHDLDAARRSRGPTGALATARQGGDLEPWRLWWRYHHPLAEDDIYVGGSAEHAVDRVYRRDGRRRMRDVDHEIPPSIEDVPVAVREWHVVAEDDIDGVYSCAGCREGWDRHPVRRRWPAGLRPRPIGEIRSDRQWESEMGWGYRCRETTRRLDYEEQLARLGDVDPPPWIDAPWYPIPLVASLLGMPAASVRALALAHRLRLVDGDRAHERGYLDAASTWALIEAQALGIIAAGHVPPSIEGKRPRRGRRRPDPIVPGHPYGQRDGVGGLRAIAEAPERKTRKHRYWHCECLWCGGEATVRADRLRRGKTTSCGCRQAEVRRQRTYDIADARAQRRRRDDD